ncbi:OsmC-like protein [Psychromonas sp. CNPT3]|uniref:OsmC family protein n=1 Tax=Psychromonas sp. CNPT3 TaxID=314282 RepID=UPI00006E56A0|nr:OsmC family protein [Psychromonas sp. CNPT3]AGH81545.1 OsmC-like protein [Psychromonas sp. CNPT3]
MQPLPHYYHVQSHASPSNYLRVKSHSLPDLNVASPLEFDGPGGQWSPATLLMSSLSSSYLISFKTLARHAQLDWVEIDCVSNGLLDRVEKITQFVTIKHNITLKLNSKSSAEEALMLLHKAEEICLISNSMKCEIILDCNISIV